LRWIYSRCNLLKHVIVTLFTILPPSLLLRIETFLNYNRHERFSQKNGWKFEAVDIMESDLKGYKACFHLLLNDFN
jgi:hypothetical protein